MKIKLWCALSMVLSGFYTYAQPPDFRIAFGSCSKESSPNQMWSEINALKPNVWIWIGDNIYGDTHDMQVLRKKYDQQKSHPGYQQLSKQSVIMGTWDDHDYGMNDGGKNYSRKQESKIEFLRFLDIPDQADVRTHQGVYQSYTLNAGNKKIKFILLDTRSFRDTLYHGSGKGGPYDINPDGDILGEAQWNWLESELKNSDAQVHIIASSIQFIPDGHHWEKWGNFPKSKQRMISLLSRLRPSHTVIISGDRHIAELSKISISGWNAPLYDFTSSGLTHSWDRAVPEPNKDRVGEMIYERNFGVIDIRWKNDLPVLTGSAIGKDGKILFEYALN
jgi:alkaline phosphatase D